MRYSCSRMLPDGAWWYAEDDQYHWIDNFHTGYNLDSLKCYIEYTGDTEFSGHLARGLRFFKDHFFRAVRTSEVLPRSRVSDRYSMRITGYRHARILCSGGSRVALSAIKVADWTIRNMQDRAGFFYYRKYPLGVTARTPMLHWGQATMFKGLAHLISRLSPGERSSR